LPCQCAAAKALSNDAYVHILQLRYKKKGRFERPFNGVD